MSNLLWVAKPVGQEVSRCLRAATNWLFEDRSFRSFVPWGGFELGMRRNPLPVRTLTGPLIEHNHLGRGRQAALDFGFWT